MEYIIFTCAGFVLFIIGYSFGMVNRDDNDVPQLQLPSYHCGCGCGGNWCYRTMCSSDCYRFNHPPLSFREAEARQSGLKEGYESGHNAGIREGLYNARKSPEEIIAKLSTAMKPLDELKREFGIDLP